MQRFFDIIFSGVALSILSPLLLLIIFILRLTGEGEIFFLQDRIGKNGKKFKLLKFVTMIKNSPNIGTGSVTMKNDSRILPVGRFLRKSKINELPQLVNIFIGDMSVIGPRPLTKQTFNLYDIDTQNIIQLVSPGLSGIGSIVFRGEEEIMHGASASLDFYKNIIAPYKGSIEKWFVANKSLYIYFLAILVTIWTVIQPNSKIIWRCFKGIPEPPEELKLPLNFEC